MKDKIDNKLIEKILVNHQKNKEKFFKDVKNKKVNFVLPNGNLTKNPDDYKYFERR